MLDDQVHGGQHDRDPTFTYRITDTYGQVSAAITRDDHGDELMSGSEENDVIAMRLRRGCTGRGAAERRA